MNLSEQISINTFAELEENRFLLSEIATENALNALLKEKVDTGSTWSENGKNAILGKDKYITYSATQERPLEVNVEVEFKKGYPDRNGELVESIQVELKDLESLVTKMNDFLNPKNEYDNLFE